jgi:single-strand DNA-binding protein
MNKVELIGRLTKDPEIRYTQTNNTMVASFTLAVNRRFAKEGEQQADFINCIAWSKTAEFVNKYFNKGQQVAIVGRIQTRNWEDDNGQKRYATEVIAEEVYFADSKKDIIEDNGEPTDVTNDVYNETMVTSGDDLPF